MKYGALLRENFKISLNAIRSNPLRTILTILIIAFGIMALVGILTAIESIKGSINNSFSMMGANTFTITSRGMRVHMPGKRYRTKNHSEISFQQAQDFKENFEFPATVSVWTYATDGATVKYQSNKTNPNITVYGVDEDYLSTAGEEIEKGRLFSNTEIEAGRAVALIGQDLVKKLFGKNVDPIDKYISVGGGKY
ncbi:MAG: ABC transporter permease, partial [Tenuifilaceae bacterium]|nr:ABC transporter permease [Tenuifilaceae bacterium]